MPKDANLNFSLNEYAERLAKTRAAMAKKDILQKKDVTSFNGRIL